VTAREQGVADEIRRLAREELAISVGGDGEELAGALDSMALLGLAVAVEDRFRIALTEEDAASARTLSELAVLVAARLPGEDGP
jgi:acyl carrier protein